MTLGIATYNVGGPSISIDRFKEQMRALIDTYEDAYQIPQIVCLTEFKQLAPTSQYRAIVKYMLDSKFHFITSERPTTTGGIAFLVATSLSPFPPSLTNLVPDRVVKIEVHMHSNLEVI